VTASIFRVPEDSDGDIGGTGDGLLMSAMISMSDLAQAADTAATDAAKAAAALLAAAAKTAPTPPPSTMDKAKAWFAGLSTLTKVAGAVGIGGALALMARPKKDSRANQGWGH